MLERKKRVAELITSLHNQRGTESCKTMILLFGELIEDVREQNDYAAVTEVPVNQGKIAALKTVREAIINGVPARQK